MIPTNYDYIIIGGGVAGCALAARLYENDLSLQILLIEAGANAANHPLTSTPLACFGAHFSDLDWAYSTVPQKHLNGRTSYIGAGKALGGGSAINYGSWTRGNATDFDQWAKLVGDPGWSYEGLLPYFKKTETHLDSQADPAVHGSHGPIYNSSVSGSHPDRKYGLREPLRAAWERLGVEYIPDANAGAPLGLGELVENWREGKRQISSEAYGVTGKKGITVLTETTVARVVIEEGSDGGRPVARGVEVVEGQKFLASKEVVVSAGAYRTPQILMLSGIGPRNELAKHDIAPVAGVDAPDVGRNLHEHFSFTQWWKIRHPEQGLSMGTPLWNHPAYASGLPCDWIVTLQAPRGELEQALKADGETELNGHPCLSPKASHIETLVVYAPALANIVGVDIPMDGTHIASAVLVMVPTSRGRITLTSADPAVAPTMDPNFYATEVDRAILRAGVRQVLRLFTETPEGKDLVESEATGPDFTPLAVDSTDEEIDAQVRARGTPFYHPGGTASMGKVVDTELRVKGMDGLRVVDASVLPLSVTGHTQLVSYAIAEKAADLISGRG